MAVEVAMAVGALLLPGEVRHMWEVTMLVERPLLLLGTLLW